MINIYIWANRDNKGFKSKSISIPFEQNFTPNDFLDKILHFDMDTQPKKFAYGKVPKSDNFFVFFSKIKEENEDSSIVASFAIEFSKECEYKSFVSNFYNKFLHKNDNNTELIKSFKDIIISSKEKGELKLNQDNLKEFIKQMIEPNSKLNNKKRPTNNIKMIIYSKNDNSEKISDFFSKFLGNACIIPKYDKDEQVTFYSILDKQPIKKKLTLITITVTVIVTVILILHLIRTK